MTPPERQTRSYLTALFARHGFHPRHDLGQNFLIDLNIIEFIVREAELTTDDVVLEVGAGTGGLTTYLCQSAGAVVSVELDPRMVQLVRETTAGAGNLTLIHGDALRTKNRLADELLAAVQARLADNPARRLKLVANLPYGAATPVVTNLVATDLPWTRMVITIQYELGERMQAAPGSSHYGGLAVWLQSQARVELLRKLGPTVFWPRPKVDSAIVRITPDDQLRRRIRDRAGFHEFIRRIFQHRRKHLRKVLSQMELVAAGREEIDALLEALSIDPAARAEDLEVGVLVELSNRLAGTRGGESSPGASD